MIDIIGFFICGIIIFFAGQRLCHYGEQISEITGLGNALVGFVLMASVTSLPELMVGISSSAIVKSADLAVGDVLGSCAFNLGILSLMDALIPGKKPIFSLASSGHILVATFGIILIGIVGIGLFLPINITIIPSIGLTSTLFAFIYFISISIMFKYNKKFTGNLNKIDQRVNDKKTLQKTISLYVLFAIIIVIAASFIPLFAERIAEQTGLGKSFVGTFFLAISTSLPEIAVSIAAVKSGAIDLTVGNLLGSNIFNVFILFIDDLFYLKGNLLNDASEINLISVFFTIIMSGVAIIGLVYKSDSKKWLLAWDSFLIFLIYLINIILLYKLS